MEDLNPILECFQAAHSILNVAWPPPGVKAMEGARSFLGTNVFKMFRGALETAEARISQVSDCGLRTALDSLTKASLALLGRIETQSERLSNAEFDSAINLLYLATGIMWHLTASNESNVRELKTGPMRVEPLDQLAKRCNWNGPAQSSGEMLARIGHLLENAANIQ